jgi:protease I
MAKKILMITGDYAEDYEVIVPLQALTMVGHNVSAVCPGKSAGDVIQTSCHFVVPGEQTYKEIGGHPFSLNATFTEINVQEFDALVIPGGRAPEYLRLDAKVLEMVRHFMEANKPVAVVCHGVQILSAANLVRGRSLTGFLAQEPEITMAGGNWVKKDWNEWHVDGNLVSAVAWPGQAGWLAEFLRVLGTTINL